MWGLASGRPAYPSFGKLTRTIVKIFVVQDQTIMSDELFLSIEKLLYGGDGLAHADGNTVFVPFVLPGEQVRATVRSRKKKLIHPKLREARHPPPPPTPP